MIFNYWVVILIFVLLPIYYLLNKYYQNIFLLVASYILYCYVDYRFLALIIITSLLNFYLSKKIHSSQGRTAKRAFLIIGLVYNLGLLGFFKYVNFFIASFVSAFELFGYSLGLPLLKIILPLGISFFTFKIIGYLIDTYRGNKSPADLLSFALFVSYFPEISAGPIGRASAFLPQIDRKRHIVKEQVFAALQLIVLGYFKKKVIADAVAPYVDQLFTSPEHFMCIDLLCGMYLYTLQIYADFSGYTDIVRGLSKLLGIEIMQNFKQPYLSRNINEFWRRWHISLSSWLRDYLYIPLGGNRKGNTRTYINLLMTMLLCGLWHGASWVFILWGVIHGIYLSIFRYFRENFKKTSLVTPKRESNIKSFLSVLLTFHLVGFAWILFRAPDFVTASKYMNSLFSIPQLSTSSISIIFITMFYLVLTLVIDFPSYRYDRELLVTSDTPWLLRSVVYASLILCISFLGESYVKPFIYFRF